MESIAYAEKATNHKMGEVHAMPRQAGRPIQYDVEVGAF